MDLNNEQDLKIVDALKNEDDLKNEDNIKMEVFLKNEVNLKNEDDLKNGNKPKNEDDLLNKDNLKIVRDHISLPFTAIAIIFFQEMGVTENKNQFQGYSSYKVKKLKKIFTLTTK